MHKCLLAVLFSVYIFRSTVFFHADENILNCFIFVWRVEKNAIRRSCIWRVRVHLTADFTHINVDKYFYQVNFCLPATQSQYDPSLSSSLLPASSSSTSLEPE